MMFRSLVLLSSVMLVACANVDTGTPNEAAPPGSAPAASSASATKTAAASSSGAKAAALSKPLPAAVLLDIYGVTFKNEDGQRLDGGIYAGFWVGESVPDASAGKLYVALSNETPGPEKEYPRQNDKVNLSGAIYQQDAGGQWKLRSKQKAFGRFGAEEKPPTYSGGSASVWLKAADGRLIWAVPTVVPAMGGARTEAYELVGVDAVKNQLTYLGTVPGGGSSKVDCKPEAKPNTPQACYAWTTTLSLVPGAIAGGWPRLEAVRKGSRYNAARRAVVPVSETAVYSFSAAKGAYAAGR